MSETTAAFSHSELLQLTQNDFFLYRLGNLALALVKQRTEAGFTFSKTGREFQYSKLLMPNTPEENNKFDPSNSLYSWDILAPGGKVDKQLGGFIHSHPCEPFEINYQRYPSTADIQIFSNYLHPVNPGHIGGILTVWPEPMSLMQLTLYRANPERFDSEAIPNVEKFQTQADLENWPNILSAAGLQFADILYKADGTVLGLENLEKLYSSH